MYMSSIHQRYGNINTKTSEKKGRKKVAYVKGAPKKIIALCREISVDGEVQTFSDEEKEKVIKKHGTWSSLLG